MPGNVFVYGTLMADEVVKLPIHRVPNSKPATITGHQRKGVKRQAFSAIIKEPSAEVLGMVSRWLS
jgi:hypothetical protein